MRESFKRIKTKIKKSYEDFIDKIDDDIAELYEQDYKSKVALNTLISLLIKKGVLTQEQIKEEMKIMRKEFEDKL